MATAGMQQRSVDFLREQMNAIDLKITRTQSAIDESDDPMEREGLQATLHTLDVEREVIHHLIMCQVDDEALSLDAQIMQRIECAESRIQHTKRWRRGERTPADYWDAQIRRNLLNRLLSYFHTWPHDHPHEEHIALRPYMAGIAESEDYAHPWYSAPEVIEERRNGNGKGNQRGYSRSAEMLFEDVAAALDEAGVIRDHLEIITEPLGNVIVTGYAHSEADHDRALNALLGVDGVFEVIEDIKIVEQDDCPLCQTRSAQRSGAHHPNGPA